MEKLPMCRVCLAENVCMYIVVNRNLRELYEKLTDMPFVTQDSRPILACFICCTKLKQCYRLLRQCLGAEELFAQTMNGGNEPNSLINQDHLEFYSGFIKSPIVHMSSIVDECQTESIAIRQETPAVCEELIGIIQLEEEHQSDELEPENLGNKCLDLADIPPHHSQFDLQDDIPLIEFKTVVEEEQEVSKKKRRARETTSAIVAKEPKLDTRRTKEKDAAEQMRKDKSNSNVLRTIKKRTHNPGTYVKETYKWNQLSFSENSNLTSPPLIPPPHRATKKSLRQDQRRHLMGSDADSDESDGEEVLARPIVPRVFRTTMETPLDQEEDAAGDPAPATDPAAVDDPAPADVLLTATDQPWRWFDFEWREFPDPPIPTESRRETFSQNNVGPTTPKGDPYDIFVDIWDRQIMEHIASETNKYAQQLANQMLQNDSLHPRSRISRWFDTTVDELYVYFGLVLAMGIVIKSRLEEYWSTISDIFRTPGFSANMSIDRFLMLNRCLHFNDNDDLCALELDYTEARLFKIQPILSHLNKKFQDMYTPAQNLALDESLLLWKGWLEFGQLIPNKAAKKGIKTYEICESQTGYLWRFEVYAHQKSPPRQYEDPLEASTSSIVLRLIQGLEHKGYTLWMDNFYNSPCLARRLKCLGFDCAGTLRTNRKFVPQALHVLTNRNMVTGQISGLTSGDVDVMVWRDNNRVAMISTYHGNSQQKLRGSTKPIVILDYNIMMGGVDRKDQLLAMYPIERKRTKVWYKKLFRRLLNVSVLNSYVILRHTSSITHRNFRIRLVKSLLSKHSTPAPSPLPPVPRPKTRVDVRHRLDQFPMEQSQRKRRLCVECKKRTCMFCVGCDRAVCMNPCFVKLHS